MIRGAVAFALVLKIDYHVEHRPVIVTTALTLVVMTTVIMGSTVSTLAKAFFNVKDEHGEHHLLPNVSIHEEVQHPNMEETIQKSGIQGKRGWF